MLCSKLHYQVVFNVTAFSHKIALISEFIKEDSPLTIDVCFRAESHTVLTSSMPATLVPNTTPVAVILVVSGFGLMLTSTMVNVSVCKTLWAQIKPPPPQ